MRFRFFLCVIAFAAAVSAQTATGPAFDVASIKPSTPPAAGGRMMGGMRGGPGERDPELYVCTSCAIPMLITRAYDIKYYQLTYPSWMDSARFDVSARVPAGATKVQFRMMLQNLLAERFKLAIHRDHKEMQVYQMAVAKGGLKVKESVPEPAKDGDPPPMTLGRAPLDKNGYPMIPKGCKGCMIVENGKARLTAEDFTMTEFAERLSNQLGGLVHDVTGLKGKYDFDLTWGVDSTFSTQGGGAGAFSPAQGANIPWANSVGPAEFEQMMISAVQSELGLKLEPKKGMVEIIVVDHVEKAPTEN